MDEYNRVVKLFEWLMEILSRDLGLEMENSLNESVGGERKELHISINYYPPCPQIDLVVGVAPHSDIGALTILLHDQIQGFKFAKMGIGWMSNVFLAPWLSILVISWRYVLFILITY
jgi:flavonol synthase